MLNLQSDLHGNHLLRALPADEWQALAPDLELVQLRGAQLLCHASHRFRHVYFPTTAIISLLHTMEDGRSVEIAAVGREGMTGVPVLTGGETMPTTVQVQCGGSHIAWMRKLLREHLRPLGFPAPPDAALHAGAFHASRADGRMQSSSFAEQAVVPLAADRARPRCVEPVQVTQQHDRRHARRASRRRDGSGGQLHAPA